MYKYVKVKLENVKVRVKDVFALLPDKNMNIICIKCKVSVVSMTHQQLGHMLQK